MADDIAGLSLHPRQHPRDHRFRWATLVAPTITANFADIWAQVMDTTPWDGDACYIFAEMLGYPRLNYRQRLDRPRQNFRGGVIPRISIVRNNLRALGSVRMDPRRLR
jgi:hypothetical protein